MRKLKVVQAPPIGYVINGGHPLAKGLVSNYLLNENGGLKAYDSVKLPQVTGAFVPGTLTNGAVYVTKQKGVCVSFDGTDDFIPLGTQSQLNLTGTHSLMCWLNTNSVAVGTKQLMSDSNSLGNLYQWGFEINRTAAKVSVLANSAAVAVTGATSLVAGVWYHVAVTRAGSTGSWTYTIYINGVQDATATVAGNPDAQSGAAIGRLGVGTNHRFNGFIKDVKIYNRALSHTEIRQLYQNSYIMYN